MVEFCIICHAGYKVERRGLAGALWVHMEAVLSYSKLSLQKKESLPKIFQAS